MPTAKKKPGRPRKSTIVVSKKYRMPKDPAGMPVWCYMEGFAPVLVTDKPEYDKLRERNWADTPAKFRK